MKWKDDPIVAPDGQWQRDAIVEAAPARSRTEPLIVLPAAAAVPALLQPSDNPNSAGRYPIGRKYTVGDQASFRFVHLDTGALIRSPTHRVTRVDPDGDRVEINEGLLIWDGIGNLRANREMTWDAPKQLVPLELQVGNKWQAASRITRRGQSGIQRYSLRIAARERITVPAGTFDAFRIEATGSAPMLLDSIEIRGWTGGTALYKETIWLMPYLNFPIRHDTEISSHPYTDRFRAERLELVSLRQWSIES